MKTALSVIILSISLSLMMTGCADESSPIRSIAEQSSNSFPGNPQKPIPADASIDSVFLWLHSPTADTHLVSVHHVTAAWDEMSVTWNSFAESYDAEAITHLLLDDSGYMAFDLSSVAADLLVTGQDNHGILLRLDPGDASKEYITGKENGAGAAFLKICYTAADSSVCENLMVVADAAIYAGVPMMNFGLMPSMPLGYTGSPDSVFQILLDFGIMIEPRLASIGDRVWMDDNADGIQDSGETGMSGVTVNLFDCADSLIATTVTDNAGHYHFGSLPEGEYSLEFIKPGSYQFSIMDAGTDDDIDSDVDPATGWTGCITLLPGVQENSIDVGLYTESGGCTYGKGYWKNHAGLGPQDNELSQHLPLWLGDEGGGSSVQITDVQTAVDYLSQKVHGRPNNGISKLYAQLLAAKLNIANGADPADAADVINDADDFLADHGWSEWESLESDQRHELLHWKDMLDWYNNGMIGPGHCGDDEPGGDGEL
jgi:hypothetical protein